MSQQNIVGRPWGSLHKMEEAYLASVQAGSLQEMEEGVEGYSSDEHRDYDLPGCRGGERPAIAGSRAGRVLAWSLRATSPSTNEGGRLAHAECLTVCRGTTQTKRLEV
jgi:hypothetical protein